MKVEKNNSEKIVLSNQQKIQTYSSNFAKRGLELANTLKQNKVESAVRELHSQVWKCKLTIPGSLKEVTFSNGKTLTIWSDNESIAVSRDNHFLVSADNWGDIKVWNLLEERFTYSLKCEKQPEEDFLSDHWMKNFSSDLFAMGKTHSLYVLPDNETAICINSDGITAWNLILGKQKYFFPSGSNDFFIDSKYQKIVVGHPHSVETLSCITGQALQKIDFETNRSFFAENIVIASNGSLVAVSGNSTIDWGTDEQGEEYYINEHSIEIWDLHTGSLLHTLDKRVDYENEKLSPEIAITRDNRNLISFPNWNESDPIIKIWDLDSAALVFEISESNELARDLFESNSIVISNGRKLIYSSFIERDNECVPVIKIWDLDSAELVYEIFDSSDLMIASNDENLIYSSSTSKSIIVQDLDSGSLLHTFNEHSDSVQIMKISSDSSWLFSGSANGTVRIWNLKTGNLLHTLVGHEHPIKSILLSQDETIIVSTDYQGTVKVWQTN